MKYWTNSNMPEDGNNTTKEKWIVKNRRGLLIHGSIVAAFLIFLVFFSGPIFSNWEKLHGISQLHKIKLPSPTNNIQSALDEVRGHDDVIEIKGWAFIEGQGSEKNETFLVLKSSEKTLIFDTMLYKRLELNKAFPEVKHSLEDAGFMAIIPAKNLKNDRFNIGIYIRNDNMQALEYTPASVGGEIKLQKISLPAETDNISYAIDRCEIKDNNLIITGWAHIEGRDAGNGLIYLVLKSGQSVLVYNTLPAVRSDVTRVFSALHLNLDNSGFSLSVPAEKIAEGEYTIGIYIRKDSLKAMEYTGKTYMIP